MNLRRLHLGLVIGALLAGLLGSPASAQDQPVMGAIHIIVPDVWITPADGDEVRLSAASVIDAGETLRTDENGVALITWASDGSESALGQNSRLTVDTLSSADGTFTVETTLEAGRLVTAFGGAPGEELGSALTISTPAFDVQALGSEFELWVTETGETTLVVTWGRVEVLVGDEAPFPVDANHYLVGAPGIAQVLSTDGVTPTLAGVCTAATPTNLNVRLTPSEDSRRLGGTLAGQVFWVRSATEGNLWLQVYFQTDPLDEEARNFGWIYGPAVQLDAEHCGTILRSALDGRLFGGPGFDNAAADEAETDSAG